MRKVTVVEYMSLDGVMEEPHTWHYPFWHDELAKYQQDQLKAYDALLLGRVTYQAFAATWPHRQDEVGFADKINNMPKYVASTTLSETEWNATLIKGDIAEEVARLKNEGSQNLLIYGSADFVQTLMRHALIDEYQLIVFPVVLGSGKRLFRDGSPTTTLSLVSTRTISTGVVILTYQRVSHPKEETGAEV